MKAANCIFCCTPGSAVKITGEDVLSKWIDDVLTTDVTGDDRSFERTVTAGDGTRSQATWPAHSLAGIKVDVVCGPCNNGWMCSYDGKVKHWLKDAILGNNITLTMEQQLDVATWATMKAMVLEFYWGKQPLIFTQDDRDLLYQERRPPANVQVRLAAVESQGYPISVRNPVSIRGPYTPTPRPQDLHLQLTMAWGCLVVQVIGGPVAGDEALRRSPVRADTYVQIYPPAHGPVSWPPATPLNDRTLEVFADPNAWRDSAFLGRT